MLFEPAMARATSNTNLVCEGKYQNLRSEAETKLKDAIISISDDEIIINGIHGFANPEEKYRITIKNDVHLFFQHPNDSNYKGSINRYTGAIYLTEHEAGKIKPYKYFDGICRAARKIF
jgi:hypothetical protein